MVERFENAKKYIFCLFISYGFSAETQTTTVELKLKETEVLHNE